MAFALGSIRDLEQRDFNSSAENVDEEETGEGNEEEPLEEENSDGEEADEELAIDNDENVSEEAPSDGEDVEDIEDPETDPGAPIEDESAGGETTESLEEEETYQIQSGDTLFSISRAFYGDGSMVDEIIRLNNIEDINKIQVGDVLRLPPRD